MAGRMVGLLNGFTQKHDVRQVLLIEITFGNILRIKPFQLLNSKPTGMIKALLSILLSLIVFAAYAQMNKRTFVGGEVNFSWDKRTSDYENNSAANTQSLEKGSSLTILPSAGYFVSEHFALGMGIGYFYGNSNSESNPSYPGYFYATENRRNSAIFRPFARYCHFFANNKVGIFGQLEVRGGFGENRYTYFYTDSTTTSKINFRSFSSGIRPGLIAMITKKIGLEATFGYLGYTYSKENGSGGYYYSNGSVETKYQFLDLDFGLSSLYFGMQFYFGGDGRLREKEK